MFWLDGLVDAIIEAYPEKEEFIIRDEKTLSGRVHVGSLRGVVIHGLVAQALQERGKKARFLFEFNDADPMDGMPIYLDEGKFRQHMGKPLKDVPSPDGKAKDYPTYFGEEFLKVINKIGFYPEIVRASEQYENGVYDEWIEKALKNKEKIRGIYRQVSGSEKPADWYPLQVICEKCGKVGSTKVTGFDGKEVEYHCVPKQVDWAVGCDYKGKVSPFSDPKTKKCRGKLPWKVEWPVKWLGYKVDIEGSGKDHCAAGGSHDVGVRICSEVFGGQVPFNIPYEFFLFEGAKMSSSKGMGATAHEMGEALPPELLRFLLTRIRPQTPINFNADGETIPRLYDDYDKNARVYFEEEDGHEDLARAFYFSQTDAENIEKSYLPRFSRVAFFVQIPHLNIQKEIATLKGKSLTAADKKELEVRENYAKKWLADYASDNHRFEIAEQEIPKKVSEMFPEQKVFLRELANVLEQFEKENAAKGKDRGEALHEKIHDHRKSSPLEAREGFSAIYMALIGKESGPQAGWFLEALDPKFVIERFRAVASLESTQAKPPEKKPEDENICIDPPVHEKFPNTPCVTAILENIEVKPVSQDFKNVMEQEIKKLNIKDIKKNSEILAEYRAMYKQFAVDPMKRKPAPQALIDRLANEKEIHAETALEAAAQLLMIKYQVGIHIFDAAKVQPLLTLRFAEHGETFQAIGETQEKNIQKGELVWSDARSTLILQDYNHTQSEKTKVTDETKKVIVLITGNAKMETSYLEKVLAELKNLLV